MRPNLFSIATKELSQDAFITWLLQWADDSYLSENEGLCKSGKEFVKKLLSFKYKIETKDIKKVNAGRQWANIDIWAEIRPRIEEAFARKIDNAMFFGVDKPTDWRAGLVPSVVTAGAEVTETGKLYSDINDVMTKVEESGYNVNGILGGVGLKGKFRMMTDTTGQPLNTTEIGSVRREFMDNGVWDKSVSSLIAGDFSQAVYSIRQDITYKLLDQAVIQDPSDGTIMYNLAQEDMVALRVVMRLGWEIPNPVNAENETATRFPFASLKPEGTVSL